MTDGTGLVLFVDCETTGLTHDDRIVTLGWVAASADWSGTFETGHLIFNPGRPSNPFAARVHGYDDWTLRHQPGFDDHAEDLAALFSRAGRIVAHNASFDQRFIRTAFSEAGISVPMPAFDCTMRAWRRRHGSPAGIDPVSMRLGFPARGRIHGALEDAWVCMRIHAVLEGLADPGPPMGLKTPVNFVEPEPRPIRGQRALYR